MPRVELSLPPDPAFVRVARLVAAETARKAGVDEDVLYDLRLAVGQACALAVAAHCHVGLLDPLSIHIDDRLPVEVAVRDRVARPVASGGEAMAVLAEATAAIWPGPLGATEPELPATAALRLIEGLTEELDLSTGPDGSVLRMRWRGASA